MKSNVGTIFLLATVCVLAGANQPIDTPSPENSGNGGNGDARVPTVGKTIINNPHPTKRVYEHGIQQPNFPHDPQHIRQLLQEALSIIRNQYEGRRDFLSAPIIPLVPWQQILEILAILLEVTFQSVEPIPAYVASNVNQFVNLLRNSQRYGQVSGPFQGPGYNTQHRYY